MRKFCKFVLTRIYSHKLVFGIFALLLLVNCHSIPNLNSDIESEAADIPENDFSQKDDLIIPAPSTLYITDDMDAQEKILSAFAIAYPEKINTVEFYNNDWTMLVCGKRFYYAHSRFLPEELRENWEEYHPYDFYVYPWAGTAKERRIAIENPVFSIGSSFLFDTLYTSFSEDESWDLQEKYSFLGVKMLVHHQIKPLLDRISDHILIASQTDPSINEWINELQTSPPTAGWNWRTIINTNRRSNHSYGTAIDLQPKDLKGRLTYWQWKDTETIETIDRNIYYIPPDIVIKIFEDHGFIWGGKWDLLDTMHFEYRPEILILNNFIIHF